MQQGAQRFARVAALAFASFFALGASAFAEDRRRRPSSRLCRLRTLKPDLSILVDGEPVPRGDLAAALDRTSNGDRERRVFVEADKSVAYGEVMALMNDLRAAGRLKIGLVGIEWHRRP